MLSILGETSANTGQILGDASKGIIKNIAIFGGEISAANMADAPTLEAFLAAASLKAKSDSGKLYWLPEVQNIEDRSEQNTTGALNLGVTVILKEGKTGYELKVDGSSEFCKQLRKWNNKTIAVLEYDSNKKLWGRLAGTSLFGYTAKIFTNQPRVASGQNVEEGIVTFTVSFLSSTEYGDQAKAVDLSDVDTSLIKAQNDAPFEFISKASNVHKFSWRIPLGVANKYFDVLEKFATQIGTNDALFEAHTGATYGTALTIDSIAITNGELVVTFDSTEYTALAASTKIRFRAKAPSVLDVAGITDIESVEVITVK